MLTDMTTTEELHQTLSLLFGPYILPASFFVMQITHLKARAQAELSFLTGDDGQGGGISLFLLDPHIQTSITVLLFHILLLTTVLVAFEFYTERDFFSPSLPPLLSPPSSSSASLSSSSLLTSSTTSTNSDGSERDTRSSEGEEVVMRGRRLKKVFSPSSSFLSSFSSPTSLLRKWWANMRRGRGRGSGSVVAVDGVDVMIQRGECYTVLGPNGAGKSTIISMLAGRARPTSGEVEVEGSVFDTSGIGVCMQENALFPFLSGKEHLHLFSYLRHTMQARVKKGETWSREEVEGEVEDIKESIALKKGFLFPSKTYSGGMKRKLCLAMSMIANDGIAVVDEPSSGVDVVSKRCIWASVRSHLLHRRRSLLLTTHSMEEAEVLSSRVALMSRGKIVKEGSPQTLIDSINSDYVVIIDVCEEGGKGRGEGEGEGEDWMEGFDTPSLSTVVVGGGGGGGVRREWKRPTQTGESEQGRRRVEADLVSHFSSCAGEVVVVSQQGPPQQGNGSIQSTAMTEIGVGDGQIKLRLRSVRSLSSLCVCLHALDKGVYPAFSLAQPSLEDVFFSIVQGEGEMGQNEGGERAHGEAASWVRRHDNGLLEV
uniref:ABC transporter domain-containing protein n=2 Tax=Palpitomonas bilix TaxID=652834 RepID=A0A7S3DLB9_9EUKA|mmetsp:Transcript_42731/g.110138  ORF Transcript_42731/g.110138 Transcript_42731/m.110138 type:complete len:598 (+) Transcript_42731:231-2024(+)